jgi:eukaryotic-like serine/threonine-protein kinase
MDADTMALFRVLADRSLPEREDYYQQRQVPAQLRADVESLLQFDKSSSDSLHQGIAAAADNALLKHDQLEHDGQSAMQPERPVVFQGTARFAVQRQLGAGAFGTVYQVWDREQQATVAVKVLHRWQSDHLFRFKREFRALVDVRHPNLVRLYELFSEADQWFFSMELVDGEGFLDYVRPGGHCDLQRLRAALGQLTDGIQTLHDARRLHRDLKPANALVTPAGRVVVLDFSLVHEVDELLTHANRTLLAGTPAYMAPEQVLDGQVSEASDWYAVGVMLFQALTGVLPHTGSLQRLWTPESQNIAVDPRAIETQVPADLGDLCWQLLKRRPEERADATAIRSAIGATATAAAREHLAESHTDLEQFVGRSELLRELEMAFANTQQGRLNVVLVHGRSGIGKTALVRRFLADLAHRHTNLIVLKGRCYEFESVPYKGLDALVDECSRYLQRLPASRVEALLPRDACFLPKLFPVLARIPAIAAAPARSDVMPDVQELRQRTFQALRELLARTSDRQPLVIWIDDLQWGDRDCSTFLGELCVPPQQPPLLVLLTYRSGESESNPTLEYLHQVLASQCGLGTWHELEVDNLTDAESRDLLADLLRKDHPVAPKAFATIVREAGGHPLFLQQLARFASSHGIGSDRTSGERLTLRTVLQDRVRGLPAFAREVLELACVAAQPLTPAILWAAADAGGADDRAEALALLIRERLARSASGGTEGGRRVEPFHDQVRTAVVELLTKNQRRARHAHLAHVLAQQRDIEPQILVTHYLEAGDRPAAFEAAIKAAAFADTQLAFDHAARFYQTALDTADLPSELNAQLYRKLADALGHAGRGRDSAQAYLKAADCAGRDDPLERIELTRRAAEQLLISGNTEAGLAAIRMVLRAVKIRFPESSLQSLTSLVFRRTLVMLRGVSFEKRPARQLADSERILIDTCWSVAVGLSMVDTIRGADFQARHLLLALNAGEPFRVARALAMEVAHRAVSGRRVERQVKKLLEVAGSLAEELEDPYPSALMASAAATLSWSNGRWRLSLERADEAQRIFSERCASPSWETVTAQIFSMGALVRMGELNEHRRRMPGLTRAVQERGNRYAQVSLPLLSYAHVTTLADDEPQQAAETVRQLIEAWTTSRYDLQRFWATYARAEIHLYAGDGNGAWREVQANARNVRDSLLLRIQTIRICWQDLSARSALAAAGSGRTELLREAQRFAGDLEREDVQWARGLAGLVRASLLGHRGETAQAARLLARAEGDFTETDMKLHAATAHWTRNRLIGDSAGTGSPLDRVFEAEGVRCPSRMAATLAPGPWHL